MTTIVDVEQYDSFGNLVFKNYTTLIDGKYNVAVYGEDLLSLPRGVEIVAGDFDDTLNVDTSRDLVGTFFLGNGNDVANLVTGGEDKKSGIVHGGAGNDTVSGYNIGYLYGDEGNDTLYGGLEVYGGVGDDNARAEYAAFGGDGNDTVNAFEGAAYGDDGYDKVTSALNAAYGGNGNDIVIAYNADGYGDAGNDVVVGRYSASGGDGNDTLYLYNNETGGVLNGGDGNDRMIGGISDDLLIGGTGKDYFTGGYGADVFKFEQGDLSFGYAMRDEITDFELGSDKIDLTSYSEATVNLVHEAMFDRVKIDLNGDQKTDFLIQVRVVGSGALSMDDLLLI